MSTHGNYKHGHGYITPTYKSWLGLRSRIKYGATKTYKQVSVDDRWSSFENFLADMGERPEGTSIDRIDNNRGYYPDNCRWATKSQQQQNKGLSSNNTSGTQGVFFQEKRNKWRANIVVKGKRYDKRFNSKEEAIEWVTTMKEDRNV